jgi:hypothetical protein
VPFALGEYSFFLSPSREFGYSFEVVGIRVNQILFIFRRVQVKEMKGM